MNMDRRDFLKSSVVAGAGLTLGFYLPSGITKMVQAPPGTVFAPNAFIRIAPDDSVTVLVKHLEMGQGVSTGLPLLVAEELEADWRKIKVDYAPADLEKYGNLAWGGSAQGTGGSTAIAGSWEQLRKAGATAREMLIAAAAEQWQVEPKSLKAENGFVVDPKSKRRASYGQLAERAGKIAPPREVALKAPKDWKLIGKKVPRTDSAAKTDGTARFGGDVKLPGMLSAVVARPPLFGAKLKRVDSAKAQAMPGVKAIVETPRGVAVAADTFWHALQAREALTLEWDDAAAVKVSSDALLAEYRELLKQSGTKVRADGDADKAIGAAAKKIDATFEFPFLAHAAMEPLNCVVSLKDDACEIWGGHQLQTLDQAVAAGIAGLKPAEVTLHSMISGGSFGRRATPSADWVGEAVMVAKALREKGSRVPVKVLWTREDDMRGGYYRPLYVHRIRAGVDAQGNPVGWWNRIVGQSILIGTPFEQMLVKDGVDKTSVEGSGNLPYAIPNLFVDLHSTNAKVGALPVLWWRSVGHTHTAFATEVMVDQLAHAAGKDPFEFRRALLAKHPRHKAALELAAQKAGWGTPLPKGRGRGIAVHESFNSYVAEVAEVTVKPDGSFRVDRVVCGVDCGVAVSPDVIRAQMEGGIGFGLSAALYSKIELKEGRVEQSNFHDYPNLRIGEMPKVEVHIVPSEAAPTGVGEPGVPPIAPAVANALFAATGKLITRLPLADALKV